jgi:DNA-3-methyladenine glycosylase II
MASPHRFTIRLPGPIDFAASLEIFRRSGDDLLDRWDGKWLLRTIQVGERTIAYACRPAGSAQSPVFAVIVEDPAHAAPISELIAHSFAPLTREFRQLCNADQAIGRLAKVHLGFRPILHPNLLVALVRSISAQQVNLRWAATVRRRLAERFGDRHEFDGKVVYSLNAARLAALEIAEIRALQFTTRKAEYVINVARAVGSGDLVIERLRAMADDEVIEAITAIRGLGRWSAEWILARTLGRPRVSAGDLGVRKAVGKAYFGGRMPSPDEVRQATAHWGDAAALAQELLLHAQHLKTLGATSPPAP